jgi:hypothetical protein
LSRPRTGPRLQGGVILGIDAKIISPTQPVGHATRVHNAVSVPNLLQFDPTKCGCPPAGGAGPGGLVGSASITLDPVARSATIRRDGGIDRQQGGKRE